MVNLTEEQRMKIQSMITEDDIRDIKQSMIDDDYSYLSNVLNGEGYTPLNELSNLDLVSEFLERFYDAYDDKDLPDFVPESFVTEIINLKGLQNG